MDRRTTHRIVKMLVECKQDEAVARIVHTYCSKDRVFIGRLIECYVKRAERGRTALLFQPDSDDYNKAQYYVRMNPPRKSIEALLRGYAGIGFLNHALALAGYLKRDLSISEIRLLVEGQCQKRGYIDTEVMERIEKLARTTGDEELYRKVHESFARRRKEWDDLD